MSKKKKQRNEWEKFYADMAKAQNYEKPDSANGKYVRIYAYMLLHANYKKMSSRAKVCLLYVKDWAYGNESFRDKGIFPFSPLLLEEEGIMSAKIGRMALLELEHYGFIQKENNATYQSGIIQMWSLSEEWYKGEKPKYKPKTKGGNWHG